MLDRSGEQADEPVLFQKMRQTMSAFTAAWSRGDIDGLMTLFGEDPLYRTSSGIAFKGRASLREGLVKMCQPSDDAAAAEPTMHLFGRCCLIYWRLELANGDRRDMVDGVDVITFDNDGLITVKDAYRKLV